MGLSFKTLAVGVIAAGIFMGVAFGAGVAYGRGDPKTVSEGLTQQQIQQLYGAPTNPGAAQGGGGQGGAQAGGSGAAAQVLARSTTGKVTAIDGDIVTIETARGSQKVKLSPSATVSRTTNGSVGDIAQGSMIFASGTRNSDGTFDATSISQVSGDLQSLLTTLSSGPAAGGGQTPGSAGGR
jgi:hypothetical protein